MPSSKIHTQIPMVRWCLKFIHLALVVSMSALLDQYAAGNGPSRDFLNNSVSQRPSKSWIREASGRWSAVVWLSGAEYQEWAEPDRVYHPQFTTPRLPGSLCTDASFAFGLGRAFYVARFAPPSFLLSSEFVIIVYPLFVGLFWIVHCCHEPNRPKKTFFGWKWWLCNHTATPV